ncbi:MAG: V-type ATP synthase subunit A, partial [Mariniphaga sp.]
MEREDKTTGKVVGIVANLVMVEVDGPVAQNEICFIALGSENLMAEVIKITGKIAYVQVFESTRGLKTGSRVEFQGHMLEVSLAPGILSRNYDGLQNDLDKMDGIFLKRGDYTDPLDREKKWAFTPLAKVGDEVAAGDWLGEVNENDQPHKIMVPFKMQGTYKVKEIVEEGEYTVDHKIAVVENGDGTETTLTMVQKWPVKVAIGNYKEKLRPFKLLETGVRCMDTLNPITEGGTGFIPGPFGTGKTV